MYLLGSKYISTFRDVKRVDCNDNLSLFLQLGTFSSQVPLSSHKGYVKGKHTKRIR